ncbi:MAG: hypothetical protein NZ740_10100 [Kiritimatiellae bacterium]|nr:hypothetical protein [Kiritimatiellia bacterium]MDW8459444.1 hypothetical protein [Verrucomicrobiota bacterium]
MLTQLDAFLVVELLMGLRAFGTDDDVRTLFLGDLANGPSKILAVDDGLLCTLANGR